MRKVAIVGSGSWGSALAIYLGNHVEEVSVWSFSEEEKNMMNDEHLCKFLPNCKIPENVVATNSFEEAFEGAEVILHVTPSKFVRETIQKYKNFVKKNQIILMCSKGFESETLKTLDEVIEEELPGVRYGILSGPSHAEEVSIGIPTALVIASHNEEVKNIVMDGFKSETLRIYSSSDVKGVELGGALKNIIAFCAGISVGLELGDNTFAALATRGLVEIVRLGTIMGAQADTFYGLSGLGDLIVTCSSEHSRNRRAGKMIGQGHTIAEARKEIGMVIESVDNIDVAYQLARKYNVEMPIVDGVYNVLYNHLDPKEAVRILMTRSQKEE
ncbi:MAG: NAD(P)-dependent glycerol-3-phosphate dehydrogenase [Clostridia bacterium]|nr:NAD(P)-dependent glycerol-3-phosphate dehydrogenase [Clostridia bacterium]